MSFTVLVVPEDPMLNGYILKPLVERILYECGKPKAKVTVLPSPRTRGYAHAKSLIDSESFERYRHRNLILFLPDADGKDKSIELRGIEERSAKRGLNLICECAVQELEVWLLAGHADKLSQTWQTIRAETDLKENVFHAFLQQYGDIRQPGSGREQLMQETLTNYAGLLARCPEIKALQDRICLSVARSILTS